MRVIVSKVCNGGRGTGAEPNPALVGKLWQTPRGLPTDQFGWISVAAGDGHDFIVVSELQPAGKKKMTAEEFLRGYPVVDGMRFGPEVLPSS
jgi:methionyl-tRNA formyltransferase